MTQHSTLNVSKVVLSNEKMRLERWLEKVEGYIARYEAYLAGRVAPIETGREHVANLIELWHARVQENIQTLEKAIEHNDQHALELLGNSLESYKKQELDFEKAISDINAQLKDDSISVGVRAILSNDELYLLELLDDIRYYITEYTRVLHTQVMDELETI